MLDNLLSLMDKHNHPMLCLISLMTSFSTICDKFHIVGHLNFLTAKESHVVRKADCYLLRVLSPRQDATDVFSAF